MKKRILSAILVLGMVISTAACGAIDTDDPNSASGSEESKSDSDSGSKDIMFVSIVTGGVAWGSAQKGFEDAIEEVGWSGQYVSPTTANDTAGVIQLLDTAVTNNVDGIVTVILDANQATDVLTRAKDAGIPVVTCNTYTTEDLQNCWIGTDPHNMGVTQAETALKYFEENGGGDDGKLTACYIQTTLETQTQNEQFQAFSDTIHEKYPDAVLIQDECNSDAATASDKLAALLKSYPDMDIVVSQDGYGCPGIANYVQSEGLEDDLIVIGIDDSEEILNYVTDGALDCTIAQDFYKMGYESVYYLKDIMDGNPPAYANDSGTIIIGPDEVAEHMELLESRGLL
ncbi:substrate-binding domain-containing protein [Faecalicatena contorta]|uniref:sugar ABC transporter substrate-binding protein n=1 Tax=Faecalicatena contorta TaxID=39482 RepID=UPI00195F5333|nr:substrate-binding domain-containing protein [Faecalicatena contorta]MBM6684961.1 substrate-binding domain-containing protein [Faecalicatena contorta]MBM6710489.1 substrate-binding domain-containing protein [Faecalicatena contorta]